MTTRPARRRRRWLRVLAAIVAVLVAGAAALYFGLRHPRPAGTRGPAAEELARAVQRAVDVDAWERTGAVRWTFAGRNQHLWDRARGFARVRTGELEVLLDTARRTGRATRAGQPVPAGELRAVLDRAWAHWINDSFWLNPVAKVFDPGTSRERVPMGEGPDGLLIHYASGGVTPGDSYLWIPGADGRPRAWRMWVRVLPIPGLEASWEGWTRLRTGAWVATEHRIAFVTLRLSDVDGAATLAELEPGADPFAPLATTTAARADGAHAE